MVAVGNKSLLVLTTGTSNDIFEFCIMPCFGDLLLYKHLYANVFYIMFVIMYWIAIKSFFPETNA